MFLFVCSSMSGAKRCYESLTPFNITKYEKRINDQKTNLYIIYVYTIYDIYIYVWKIKILFISYSRINNTNSANNKK